jgi:hypothetical protein
MSRIFTTIEGPELKPEHDELEPGAFPVDALPEKMRRIAESLADVHQIDVALPGMAALATLSGAIGKSVTIMGATNGRDTHCNLYVVAGAPKSYGKGAASAAVQPIIDASAELLDRFCNEEKARLQTERELLEQDKKKLMREENPSYKIHELTQVNQRLDEITFLLETKARPGYHVGACTGAALEEHLARNDNQAFSFAPEAGDPVRIALGKYSKDGSADFDLFLSGYSVETYSSGRAGRGFKTLHPCISACWMVQPSLLRELYSSRESHDRGLTARVMAFICEHDEIPEDDGIWRTVDREAADAWNRLIRSTLEGRSEARALQTDQEAREAFRQLHNEFVRLRNTVLRDVEGEAGRIRENAIRIAGVFAVAEGADRITAGIAERAIKLCRWGCLSSLSMLEAGRTERLAEQRSRLATLLSDGPITLRDLHRRHGLHKSEVERLAELFQEFEIKEHGHDGPGRPALLVQFRQ